MSNSLQLREQRASLIHQARKLLDSEPTLSAENQAAWEGLNKEIDSLKDQIVSEERKERQTKLEAELKETINRTEHATSRVVTSAANDERQQMRAFNTWLARVSGFNVSNRDIVEAENVGVNPYANKFTITLGRNEKRTGLNVGTGSAGGYLVPVLLNQQIEIFLKYYNTYRQYCRVERTPTGAEWDYPTADATSLSQAIVAEATAATEKDPTMGKVVFKSFKYPSKCLLSKEFITDNIQGEGIVSTISELLTQVIGRGQASDFTTGAGTTAPTGLVTAATNAGSTVKNVASANFDDILTLLYSVDRIYQKDVALFMSNSTLLSLRTVKDSVNGRYLWSDFMLPVTNSIEERIAGQPVIVQNNMHDFAAGSGSGSGTPFIVAAVPSKFIIRDVNSLELEVNPYDNMNTGQVTIYATMRSDSNYIGPSNSIKFLSCA